MKVYRRKILSIRRWLIDSGEREVSEDEVSIELDNNFVISEEALHEQVNESEDRHEVEEGWSDNASDQP